MANKFFALLLVVCLVAAASVDAQLDLRTQCFNSCVAEDCGENPSLWCKFICNFRCASTEMENGKLIYLRIRVIFVLYVS